MSKDESKVRRIDDKTTVPFSWLVTAVVFACGGAWATFSLIYGINSKIDNTQKDVHVLKANVHRIMAKDHIQPVEDMDEETSKSPEIFFYNANAGGK